MGYPVTLLPGDGIGPEVTSAMRTCVDATGVAIDWDVHPVGDHSVKETGSPMPDSAIESIRKNRVAIKGPIITPVGSGFRSVNVMLRQALDLYACVRPARSYPGTRSLRDDIDIVIFRENSEDLYAGVEFEKDTDECKELISIINAKQSKQIKPDSGLSVKPISVSGTRRIVRSACEYAIRNNRRKVTLIHKANIMKYTDGLFLKEGREVMKEYEDRIKIKDCIVDNLCMQLIQRPEHFDVLVLPNLYGDIVSDLCAGLVGGLGIAPGANIGDQYAVFESVHGSAPKFAGQNKCNPVATILSAVMMLEHLGEQRAAERLRLAVTEVLAEGRVLTFDLIGADSPVEPANTTQMADAICGRLSAS